jgi:hypothetical protein
MMTVDYFTTERGLKTGLLKLDVEDYDSAALRGSIEMI